MENMEKQTTYVCYLGCGRSPNLSIFDSKSDYVRGGIERIYGQLQKLADQQEKLNFLREEFGDKKLIIIFDDDHPIDEQNQVKYDYVEKMLNEAGIEYDQKAFSVAQEDIFERRRNRS